MNYRFPSHANLQEFKIIVHESALTTDGSGESSIGGAAPGTGGGTSGNGFNIDQSELALLTGASVHSLGPIQSGVFTVTLVYAPKINQ